MDRRAWLQYLSALPALAMLPAWSARAAEAGLASTGLASAAEALDLFDFEGRHRRSCHRPTGATCRAGWTET